MVVRVVAVGVVVVGCHDHLVVAAVVVADRDGFRLAPVLVAQVDDGVFGAAVDEEEWNQICGGMQFKRSQADSFLRNLKHFELVYSLVVGYKR